MKRMWMRFVAIVFAAVMMMSIAAYAGPYGNTNQECYYNQEWRVAFTNYANQMFKKEDSTVVRVYWIENESDHSNDKAVVLYNYMAKNGSPSDIDWAWIMLPDGTCYDSAYKHNDDYSDENEYPKWRTATRHMKDLNEFSRFAPQQ